jgi:tryptophanase
MQLNDSLILLAIAIKGATLYVSLFPQAEREQRRLQFMGDVTVARIEQLIEESQQRIVMAS